MRKMLLRCTSLIAVALVARMASAASGEGESARELLQPAEAVHGPLDAALPKCARVADIHVWRASTSAILVLWSREIVRDRVEWDPNAGKWKALPVGVMGKGKAVSARGFLSAATNSPERDILGAERSVLGAELGAGAAPHPVYEGEIDCEQLQCGWCDRDRLWRIYLTGLTGSGGPRRSVLHCLSLKEDMSVENTQCSGFHGQLVGVVGMGGVPRLVAVESSPASLLPDFAGGVQKAEVSLWRVGVPRAELESKFYTAPAGAHDVEYQLLPSGGTIHLFFRRISSIAERGLDAPDQLLHVSDSHGSAKVREIGSVDKESRYSVVALSDGRIEPIPKPDTCVFRILGHAQAHG